jgi:hypothetical protein
MEVARTHQCIQRDRNWAFRGSRRSRTRGDRLLRRVDCRFWVPVVIQYPTGSGRILLDVVELPRETVSGAYSVRIQYAVALAQNVSLGVVSYSEWAGRIHRYRTRLIAALGPPFVSLKPQVAGRRICSPRFTADSMDPF